MTAINEKQQSQQDAQTGEFDSNEFNHLLEITQSILNPNGEHPEIGEFVTTCFHYIAQALAKMQSSTDKQATAKEIADDLTQRFNDWVKSREEKLKQEQEMKEKSVQEPTETGFK
ncbi:uncharacterized protein J8A68_005250 [[Candida] subhashii]|uniref:Uncharacterized protein n=1 Tax=[Candida] subhashii TaxID=561895 RepID=A0A8J5QFU9_9ASCO|nr:uncharacterized protein J8A68_005250 [[Candida] subhashii]KAG7661254.1 hypothetical protein J8A68_005250 [[Candida] subhashii]